MLRKTKSNQKRKNHRHRKSISFLKISRIKQLKNTYNTDEIQVIIINS